MSVLLAREWSDMVTYALLLAKRAIEANSVSDRI